MDDAERRQRAADKRAARERYMREHWPERWAEQQERERAQRQQHYANNREAILARQKELRQQRLEQDPEGVRARERARDRAYLERHPERVAETKKASRDRRSLEDPEAAREGSRKQSQRALEQDPDRIRRWRDENRGREDAKAREQSRRRTRLKQLRLPPRKVHRVTAAAKRANEAAAESFFQRRWSGPEKDRLRREAAPPHERARHRRAHEADAPPPLALMERLAARVGSEQERSRLAGELHEEWLFRRELPELLARFGKRHEKEVQREVRMDQAGRQVAGKTPLDEEQEILGRIEARVLEHNLTPEQQQVFQRVRARAAAHRSEQLVEIHEHLEQAPVVQELKRRLPAIVAERRPLHEPGVRQSLALEQAERMRRGAAPLDIEREVTRRVEAAVIRQDLSPRDRETIEHLQAARAHARSAQRDPSYPMPPVPRAPAVPTQGAAAASHQTGRQDARRGR